MKKVFLSLGLLAAFLLFGQAKAYDFDEASFVPSISNSIINDAGAQAYTNVVSGSEVGIYSGAANNTDSITWTFTVPAGQWLKGARVRYEPTIADLDAAPDCTMYQQRYNRNGLGTTLTSTTLALTEDTTACAVTKDVGQLCTATTATKVLSQRGDAYSLVCTFNKAATGRVYITRVGIYAQGN
jgi:hypothetical protein